MSPTVRVKTSDSMAAAQREDDARRVLEQFQDRLLDCRLLCFFDDQDCQRFKLIMGESNRGFHWPISDKTDFSGWPEHVTRCIFVDEPNSFWYKRVIDHVIYLHGSTCANRVGMTMTFAHELQHVIQCIQVPEILKANGLFRYLPRAVLQSVGLQWSDIPTEREARAVAKKIAVWLHGDEAVEKFLSERASSATDPIELADVRFIQELDTSTPYHLRDETLALFDRFKAHRSEFESLMEELKSDPDFEPVDLDLFMPRVAA